MSKLIKSVMESDQDILTAIAHLYLGQYWFEVDPCYSRGIMWRDLPQPKYKMDKYPQLPDVIQNDLTCGFPFKDNSIASIAFDPPFMFGKHGKTDQYAMTKRFTMFKDFAELEKMYRNSLQEFARVLRRGGLLAFKCQDYTDSHTTLTHCYVHTWAMEYGLMPEDIFILNYQGGRIYNSNLVQRHARKFHCYWMVFKKRYQYRNLGDLTDVV